MSKKFNPPNKTFRQALPVGLTPDDVTRLARLRWALIVRFELGMDGMHVSLREAEHILFNDWLGDPQGIDRDALTISVQGHGAFLD